MEEEQRLRTLERDLGRLEGRGIYGGIHEIARASRADDRQAIKDFGERTEKAVVHLADEVKNIAAFNNPALYSSLKI